VEWPVVLMGDIDAAFLGLPPEVLRTSMKEHQKFFSVKDPKTGRIEKFITVANIATDDDGALILAGNRKVLGARLSDARFFWENDLRTVKAKGLRGMAAPLANVTFQSALGTQADRIARIEALARDIAPAVGADPAIAAEAAAVAKADLASEMVYEFPELQGTMGRYYAKAAGLGDGIPEACEDHYSPLGPSDAVPSRPVSVAVALADKLDMLCGFWAIDEKPTGSKDPFALRRAALGVIRIALANGLRLSLDRYIDAQLLRLKIALHRDLASEAELDALHDTLDAIADHGVFGAAFRTVTAALDKDGAGPRTGQGTLLGRVSEVIPDLSDDLLSFIHDRLKVHLRDEGLRHDVIDACIAMPGNDDLVLVERRAKALTEILSTDDGENLIQAFRRAYNILTQAQEQDGVEYSFGPDPKFAETAEERALFAALDAAEDRIAIAMRAEDFTAAMQAMAALRAPVDAFFETVQVNTDNATVRRNRLNLLHRICETCLSVADLRRLEG
jgi:glycyl-tRNA synthetase beta chain